MASNDHIKPQNNQFRNQLDSASGGFGDDQQLENGSITYEKPRTRGATRMAHVWERKTQKEVHFNMLGQPNGPNKGEFVEFLGTMVRNGSLVPLDAISWLKVPQSIKGAIIDVLKEKFVLQPGFEAWALKSLGKQWRNWKNRVKNKYFNPKASLEENLRTRPDSDDERVLPEQWKNLVIFWDSIEARRLSVQNKQHRARNKMYHHPGKKSSAQIAAEMKVNSGMAEKGSDDESESEGDNVMDDDPTDCEANRDERDDLMDNDPTDYDETSQVNHFRKHCAQNGNTSDPLVRKKKDLRSDQLQNCQQKVLNDIHSEVMQDEGGRITPTQMCGTMPSPASCHRMNREYRNEIEKLMKRVDEQHKQINELMMNLQRDRHDSRSSTRISATNHQLTSTVLKYWCSK